MALGGMKPFGFASVIVAGLLDRRNLRSGRSNTSLHGPGGETTLRGIGQNARSTRFEGRQLISENRTSMPGSQVARPRLATPRKPARGRASSGVRSSTRRSSFSRRPQAARLARWRAAMPSAAI